MADDTRPNKYIELDAIVGSTISEREGCIAKQIDQRWNLGINYARTVGEHWDAQFFSGTQAVLTLDRSDDTIHLYDKRGLRLRAESTPAGMIATNGFHKPDAEGRAAVAMVLRNCAGKDTTAIIPPAIPHRSPERNPADDQVADTQPQENSGEPVGKLLGRFFDNFFKGFGIR